MSEKQFFEAPVVQFRMPLGIPKKVSTMLPISCQPLYDEMVEAGLRFEAEMLSDFQTISVTISDPKAEVDLDISLTGNGPAVQSGMVSMLERRKWVTSTAEGKK